MQQIEVAEEAKYTNHQVHRILPEGMNPDFFIIKMDNIFPVRKELLKNSGYFSKMDLTNKKVHIVKDELNVSALFDVLKYLYIPIWRFKRDFSLLHVLNASEELECQEIGKEMCLDICNNFDKYGIFLALRLSQKLMIKWIERKCWKEILTYNFEYININKTDLLDYEQKEFIEILHSHYTLKAAGIIYGLSDESIKTVLKEYCTLHNVCISEDLFCQTNEEDADFIEKIKEIVDEMEREAEIVKENLVRKRKITWDPKYLCNVNGEESRTSDSSSSSASDILKEVENLELINEEMKNESLHFIKEINEVKFKISKSSDAETLNTLGEEELDQRVLDFEEKWEELEQKYESIIQLNLQCE